MASNIQFFIISPDGERREITDNLYWFEENGVDSLMTMQDSAGRKHVLEIVIPALNGAISFSTDELTELPDGLVV